MPKQSRGFWTGDCCHTAFDGFEEAQYHELEDCSAAAAATTTTTTTQRQRGEPPHHAATMAPLAASAAAAPLPESSVFDDIDSTTTRQQQQQQQQQPARSYPLMGQHHHESHLAEADIVACRNLELFETSTTMEQQQQQSPLEQGQVGLRCLHCVVAATSASTGAATVAGGGGAAEYSVPRAIESLADAVRRIADRHLSICSNMPTRERHVLEMAARAREASKEERGPSWHEEESSRRMLVDYCTDRCQQLGIVNKKPDNSGIVFFQDNLQQQDPSMHGSMLSYASLETTASDIVPPRQPPPLGPVVATDTYRLSPMPGQGVLGPPPGVRQADYGMPYNTSSFEARGMRAPPATTTQQQLGPMPAPMVTSEPGAYRTSHPYDHHLPSSFPFFQDQNGDWYCKYCCHLPPQYRDPHFRWPAGERSPPPGDFIEHHLSGCRAYHQESQQQQQQQQQMLELQQQQQQQQQQGVRSPAFGYPQPMAAFAQSPQSGWESSASSLRGTPSGAVAITSRDLSSPYGGPSVSPGVSGVATPVQPGEQHLPAPMLTDSDRAALTAHEAIKFLVANDRTGPQAVGSSGEVAEGLVHEEDKLLLTDFLFYLMKQLRIVRFSEADRKTRGGKREKIQLGFGGLECVHCAGNPKARKFFWSGVDRLANSFAEIPGHVFKCKHCPQQIKDALTSLKQLHSEQMSRLPRGSQKVFFRRVWKRIHEDDPMPAGTEEGVKSPPGTESPEEVKQSSSSGTTGSEESIFLLERPTKEAAKALADSAMQSAPPSPSSRVLLAITEDKDFLSDTDCFIRRQLEVFCATKEDIRIAQEDRKYPVEEGQVGIRCIHCSMSKGGEGARGSAVAFPFSITGIYESVREFRRLHLDDCKHLPPATKSKLFRMRESTTLTSIQRRYYVLAARGLGLTDTKEGIRAGSESVPVVSQAVFTFSEHSSPSSPEEMAKAHGDLQEGIARSPAAATFDTQATTTPEMRKRRPQRDDAGTPDSKKRTPDTRK